ncbi:MAG: hypothetical protein R3343_03265, partial [Nitriliruptorales bacterium]|nr:hypothetical protein [Nitriliruptorales bacterium]
DGVPAAWEALPALPATRARPAAVWTGSQLVTVGGETNFGGRNHRNTFVLPADDDGWECAEAAPFEAGSEDAVWTGEHLLLYGNEQAAAYDPATGTWQALPPPPVDAPHEPFANVWSGDEWIIWGTTSRRFAHNRGVAFDPASGQWRDIAPAPLVLDQGNGVWTGDELVVFGADLDGNNRSNTPTAVGAAYDPVSDNWRRLPPVDLTPQAAGVARTAEGAVLGYDYDTRAALYHPDENRWEELEQVPVVFGECYPRNATLGDGSVFLWYCGQAAVFNPTTKTFDEIETPITTHWGRPAAEGEVEMIDGTLVATDEAVYLIGSAHEGHSRTTWRWQRPN